MDAAIIACGRPPLHRHRPGSHDSNARINREGLRRKREKRAIWQPLSKTAVAGFLWQSEAGLTIGKAEQILQPWKL